MKITAYNIIETVVGLAVGVILMNLWFDLRNLKKEYLTKSNHDEVCDLKLNPLHEDVAEMKLDIKELLRRNGGPRQSDP